MAFFFGHGRPIHIFPPLFPQHRPFLTRSRGGRLAGLPRVPVVRLSLRILLSATFYDFLGWRSFCMEGF